MGRASRHRPRRRRPVSWVVMWHPGQSLVSAMFLAWAAFAVVLSVALLDGLVPVLPEGGIGALFAWAMWIGFVRGAIVFVVFDEHEVIVVNPIRILKVPVADIEQLHTTKVFKYRSGIQVLALAVRGRRRPVPLCAVPVPQRLMAGRLEAVDDWAVQRQIPPFDRRSRPRLTAVASIPLER